MSSNESSDAGTVAYRDTLIIATPADAQKLDPVQPTDYESAQVLYLIAETLLAFDEDSLEIVPLLAESYTVEDDGLTWRFQLREGVEFTDGTPFNAEAVKFNLDRFLADSKEDHPFYIPDMPYREALFSEVVKSIEVTGPMEVVFHLQKPFVAFAANLASFPAGILSPPAFEKYGEDIARNPVGTGPYRLERWLSGSELHLKANENYWGKAPATPNIYFKVLSDPNQLYNAVITGEADIMKGVETRHLASLRNNPNVVIWSGPHLNLGYIAINNSLKKFSDKRVRQALNYAVDKVFICESLFDGTSVPSRGALPPGMMGALPNPVYPHDPDRARELLSEAGFGPGELKATIKTYAKPRPYNPAADKLALVVGQHLEEVGIDVEVQMVDFAKFLDDGVSGDYELGNIGWGSDNGDPDNFIYQTFGAQPSNLRFYSEEANRLMLEAQIETDVDHRRELYEEANRIVIEEAPVIFLNHSQQFIAGRTRVEGFGLHPTAIFRYENVKVRK